MQLFENMILFTDISMTMDNGGLESIRYIDDAFPHESNDGPFIDMARGDVAKN